MNNLRVNGDRLWQSIQSMAEIGPGTEGGSNRQALTDEDKAGRTLFIDWCEALGCQLTIDDMGNLFARRAGSDSSLPPVVTGSHLDTQPHGGKFDGIYGVLAGLEVLRTLNDANIETKASLEVVVWTNEEGARFAPAMIASGVFSGQFEKEYAWSRTDSNGITLLDELKRTGFYGDEKCGSHPMAALLEAHIEQGPVLEHNANQIGVVIGAQGIRWYNLTITGTDAHAGPTPMPVRRDALVAAADIIKKVQAIALDNQPYGVGTVGEMHIEPNSRNTIPGKVLLTVDLRNPENKNLELMDDEFRKACAMLATQHHVEINIEEIWNKPPIVFDETCVDAVLQSVSALGYSQQEIVSGAGHDACQVCTVVPTSMIFVPCANGLSHNEAEWAEPEDLEAGCNVLLQAMLNLAEH
jgi:N-carbamoyl-L-amino-acid hydrolase